MVRTSERRVSEGSAKPKALVDFGDGGTSVIRSNQIIEGNINDGKCRVICSDKEYEADLLFTGNYLECVREQADTEKKEKKQPKRKRKRLKHDDGGEKNKKPATDKMTVDEAKRGSDKDPFIIDVSEFPPCSPRSKHQEPECSLEEDDKNSAVDITKKMIIHDFDGKQIDINDIAESMENLKAEIRRYNDEQEFRFEKILLQLESVCKSVSTLTSSGNGSDTTPQSYRQGDQLPSAQSGYQSFKQDYQPYGQEEQGDYQSYGQEEQGDYQSYGQEEQGDYQPYGQREQRNYQSYGQEKQWDYQPYRQEEQGDYQSYGQEEQGDYQSYGQEEQWDYQSYGQEEQGDYQPYGQREQRNYQSYGQEKQWDYQPYRQREQGNYQPNVQGEQGAYQSCQQGAYQPYQQRTCQPYQPGTCQLYKGGKKPVNSRQEQAVNNLQQLTSHPEDEPIPPSKLVPMIMRHKTRRSLAAAMVDELVDATTRINSNVNGRGKDKVTGKEKQKLDPKIISYVKKKVFEVHPSEKLADEESDWHDCIVKIDDQGRELKRKLKKQSEV
ncbi:probable serine/threonine-protein kinase kinX isoform X2 [Dysidea avara]|uniref:probable serine/threonine-protein kinase kinX isoform X2 n=1 Tax=Dysidea avara TaxID=196820 RepID=UPI00332DC987